MLVLAVVAVAASVVAARAGREGLALATEHLDVLDGAAVQAFAGRTGRVDVLFNCAGVVHAGTVLQASDGIFNEVLAKGFLTAMQTEWDWRTSRGESTRNLEAFRSVLERTDGSTPE